MTNLDAKGAKRRVKMWTTNSFTSFSKNILLYMSSRLSKVRSVQMYVIHRTVYFGWICTQNSCQQMQPGKTKPVSFEHTCKRTYMAIDHILFVAFLWPFWPFSDGLLWPFNTLVPKALLVSNLFGTATKDSEAFICFRWPQHKDVLLDAKKYSITS